MVGSYYRSTSANWSYSTADQAPTIGGMGDREERGLGTYCLDKVLQTKLDRQGCLAHAAIAQHHQLVEHHFPRHCECGLWIGRWDVVGAISVVKGVAVEAGGVVVDGRLGRGWRVAPGEGRSTKETGRGAAAKARLAPSQGGEKRKSRGWDETIGRESRLDSDAMERRAVKRDSAGVGTMTGRDGTTAELKVVVAGVGVGVVEGGEGGGVALLGVCASR